MPDIKLPCLIHGKEGSGASFFTVRLMAEFYKQGKNIIFLSGYQMARDEFIKSVGNDFDSKRVAFLQRESSTKLIELIDTLKDIDERITLVKNVELCKEKVIKAALKKSKVILSGDLDKCVYSSMLLKHDFATKIAFSQDECSFITLPEGLPKYSGYMVSCNSNEIVSI